MFDFKTENKYTIHFKDGTSFTSRGDATSIKKSTIDNEFKWIAFHIQKEIIQKGRTLDDVKKIEYVLEYFELVEKRDFK